MVAYTVPRMKGDVAEEVAALLQGRLDTLTDLALTLKHAHWNVTGPHFIAVHTMLDPQVEAVRGMADATTAERIRALGASPSGTPGALAARRSWDDYPIGRADALAYLAALDVVYAAVIEAPDHLDPITQDLPIGRPGQLTLPACAGTPQDWLLYTIRRGVIAGGPSCPARLAAEAVSRAGGKGTPRRSGPGDRWRSGSRRWAGPCRSTGFWCLRSVRGPWQVSGAVVGERVATQRSSQDG